MAFISMNSWDTYTHIHASKHNTHMHMHPHRPSLLNSKGLLQYWNSNCCKILHKEWKFSSKSYLESESARALIWQKPSLQHNLGHRGAPCLPVSLFSPYLASSLNCLGSWPCGSSIGLALCACGLMPGAFLSLVLALHLEMTDAAVTKWELFALGEAQEELIGS